MHNLISLLKKDRNRRIINGIIFLGLLIWIIAKLKYVYTASDIRIHYKYDLIKLMTLIYLVQAIINKIWFNWIIKGIYVALMVYVLYSYIYSFFDKYEIALRGEYGIPIKTWGTFLKLLILLLILWFTNKLKPTKSNTSNSRLSKKPKSI